MPVPIPSEACVRAESGRVKSASAGRKKTGPNFMGPVRYSGTDDLSYGRRPCPALSGRCDGDAGVAGVAGVAGLAGVAGPPSGFGTAGVARVARVAGVAGVTGRLSNPTASPRTCVARRAIFAATFALATSDACSLGAATLGEGGSEYGAPGQDRKSTRLNSSHGYISYAVFCLKKKKKTKYKLSRRHKVKQQRIERDRTCIPVDGIFKPCIS